MTPSMVRTHEKTDSVRNEGFASEVFLVNVDNTPEKVTCRWRVRRPPVAPDNAPPYFQALDLLLSIDRTGPAALDCEGDHNTSSGPIPYASSNAIQSLVRASCLACTASSNIINVAVMVILVPRDGFLCRDDILELRMRHSEHVESVIRLGDPGSRFSALRADRESDLSTLLSSSPGALLASHSASSPEETLKLLTKELEFRLAFNWVLPTQAASRTVAMVGGRRLYDINRGQYGARGLFEAAQALGISVIVLDAPGHWLQGETYAYLRQDFIAIDVTVGDARLPLVIAEAVKGRGIDGIVTFSDEFVIATAKAAEILGLRTESVPSIVQAHHKDETRKVTNKAGIQSVRLINSAQLDDPSTMDRLRGLEYPIIVKPCRGAASRGVRKVHNVSMLRHAVQRMEDDGLSQYGILLETYVDGPEVDANFVLWDGELLFCEISDDFPCLADAADATVDADFVETLMVHPTGLDPTEVELLQSSLHRDLLKLGFRSGVFHVEARMRNSSMRYTETDGTLDLAPTQEIKGQPDVFLIEVNARPPGFDPVWATAHTYGVDMCALQFLHALGDRERFEAMSRPFSGPPHQLWCGNRQVPMYRNDIYVPHDFFEQVIGALPEIAPYLAMAEFFVEPGSTVSPRAGTGFIVYFILYSRKSRIHLLEMCDRVLEVSKRVLDSV